VSLILLGADPDYFDQIRAADFARRQPREAVSSRCCASSARNAQPGTWRAQLLIVGLVGAALLYGDGAITPAISVLAR